jgi:hypothetical protein
MAAMAGVLLAAGCAGGDEPEREPAVPGEAATAGETGLSGASAVAIAGVESPAGPSSGEPNLAAGADGNLYLTWIEAAGEGHVLKVSRWAGDAWSEPSVVSAGDDWFVNWADVPSLTALEDGTLVAHWLAKSGPGTYAYGIRIAWSGDGGKTWSPPVTPHRDGTETEHGFVSLVPLAADRVGAVWLDGRETAGHGHGEDGGGAMTLRYAALDRDGTLHDEALMDPRVCDCCPTDAVRLEDGTLVAVYRDRSPDEIRDIAIMRRAGGWSEPRPVHEDNWKIEGCPVNGPAIDARGRRVVVAWFTVDAEDRGHVRVAFSEDGGVRFGPPVAVDDGNPMGRVDCILQEDGSALVSWLEDTGSDGGAEIRMRPVTPDGAGPSTVVASTGASRGSGIPRLARLGADVFLAWTDVDADRVKTARGR